MPLLLGTAQCDLSLGAADATPRKEPHPMDDFLSILAALSRVHGSRTSRRGSCSASPSCGTPASDLVDDLSCLPPEEPEWLHMVNAAAARARSRGGSRCGSRRSSGAPYTVAPSRLGPQQQLQLTAQALSPLRYSSGALPNYPRLGSGESSAAGLRVRSSSSRPPHHHHLARGSEFASACDSAAGEPGCSGGSSVSDGCDGDSSDGGSSLAPTASAISAVGAGCSGEEERLALYCADEDSDPIMAGAPAAAMYLYELLGSWEVVTAAVDSLYRRIMDDAVVSGFFQGVPELRARHHMVAIVAMAFMGREAASDEWLGAMQRQLVRDHGLATRHLAILMDLVEAALRSLGVEEDMAGSALGMLTARRSGSGAANGADKALTSKEA